MKTNTVNFNSTSFEPLLTLNVNLNFCPNYIDNINFHDKNRYRIIIKIQRISQINIVKTSKWTAYTPNSCHNMKVVWWWAFQLTPQKFDPSSHNSDEKYRKQLLFCLTCCPYLSVRSIIPPFFNWRGNIVSKLKE